MPETPTVPEKGAPGKPQPELKVPRTPEPDIKYPADPQKDVLEREDQADSGPDKDNPITRRGRKDIRASDTSAPAGEAYKDEPKQR